MVPLDSVTVEPTSVLAMRTGQIEQSPPTEAPVVHAEVANVTASSYTTTNSDWSGLLRSVGWPEVLIPGALAIIQCESHGNQNAVSSTSDYGLFQINKVWAGFFGESPMVWLDPATNVAHALVIYERSGSWAPWTCSKN